VSGLLLWAGCVRDYSFEDRVRAAHAGGFDQTSLFPADVRRAERDGMTRGELRELFRAAGVSVEVIDPYTKWLPTWNPGPDITAEEISFADFDERTIFDMAHFFGAGVISLNEFFGERVEIEAAAACFASLCDRAATEDLRVALEPMPFSDVCDLTTAWAIVEHADRDNGGLTLDAWHFYRRGAELDLLRTVPSELIFSIQLNDAPLLPDGPVKEESMHRRLIPGAGELDLTSFIQATGFADGPALIGPEIFSDVEWRRPAEELGRELGAATREVLAAAAHST